MPSFWNFDFTGYPLLDPSQLVSVSLEKLAWRKPSKGLATARPRRSIFICSNSYSLARRRFALNRWGMCVAVNGISIEYPLRINGCILIGKIPRLGQCCPTLDGSV